MKSFCFTVFSPDTLSLPFIFPLPIFSPLNHLLLLIFLFNLLLPFPLLLVFLLVCLQDNPVPDHSWPLRLSYAWVVFHCIAWRQLSDIYVSKTLLPGLRPPALLPLVPGRRPPPLLPLVPGRDDLPILWMNIPTPWFPGTTRPIMAELRNFNSHISVSPFMREITIVSFLTATRLEEENTGTSFCNWSFFPDNGCIFFVHLLNMFFQCC